MRKVHVPLFVQYSIGILKPYAKEQSTFSSQVAEALFSLLP